VEWREEWRGRDTRASYGSQGSRKALEAVAGDGAEGAGNWEWEARGPASMLGSGRRLRGWRNKDVSIICRAGAGGGCGRDPGAMKRVARWEESGEIGEDS
jgi:hypothetical protein